MLICRLNLLNKAPKAFSIYMQTNEQIIRRFYTAFQQLDYTTMQDCYSSQPVFSDPVFGLLQGDEVGAMWEMLCKNARDFSLTFGDIQLLDEEYATCNWTATYSFSATGRRVVNNIKAHLRIEDGKITEHTDKFDMWKWSRQALGLSGWLLGWNNIIASRVHAKAKANLLKYMQSRG
jgi:ketosteroid isomerase-like protein